MNDRKRIGINGFGRIGRHVFRGLIQDKSVEEIVLNDINPDNSNMGYQLKFDSSYGQLDQNVESDSQAIYVGDRKIPVHHEDKIDNVPWEKYGLTSIVDSSGVFDNVLRARNLSEREIRYTIVTHSPTEGIDRYVIMGVNEDSITPNDSIISSSICDTTAIAPVAQLLNNAFGIHHGHITTLHPPLPYQNIHDGPSPSWSKPGHIDAHYVLGRATGASLLPKPTTTFDCTCLVLPELEGKFTSFSYRTPQENVSSSDLTIHLEDKTNTEEVKTLFLDAAKKQKLPIIYNNNEPLVSIDFNGSSYSANIDHRWLQVDKFNDLKMILWYDNEFGYASRVIDLVNHLHTLKE